MANLVSRDVQTTTGTNLRLIERETGLSAWITGHVKLRDALVQKETVPVEEREKWRIPLLNKLLIQKQELLYLGEDIEDISGLINSLCIN